jgi:hypothetical protein
MAKRFLTPINVLNAASDPGSASEGDLYYNTSTDKLKIYSNSTWVNVSGDAGGVTSLTGTANQISVSASTGGITLSFPSTISIGVATGTSFNSITGLSSTNPVVNGTVAVGTGTTAARADHVHPTDTSRAALSGATFTGTVIAPAATTSLAPIRIPHGTAPTSPTNGDVWTTTTGLFARINSATVGPYGIGTARTFYQTTSPSTPTTGDIWVDSDEVYTTINSNDYALKNQLPSISNPFFLSGM